MINPQRMNAQMNGVMTAEDPATEERQHRLDNKNKNVTCNKVPAELAKTDGRTNRYAKSIDKCTNSDSKHARGFNQHTEKSPKLMV